MGDHTHCTCLHPPAHCTTHHCTAPCLPATTPHLPHHTTCLTTCHTAHYALHRHAHATNTPPACHLHAPHHHPPHYHHRTHLHTSCTLFIRTCLRALRAAAAARTRCAHTQHHSRADRATPLRTHAATARCCIRTHGAGTHVGKRGESDHGSLGGHCSSWSPPFLAGVFCAHDNNSISAMKTEPGMGRVMRSWNYLFDDMHRCHQVTADNTGLHLSPHGMTRVSETSILNKCIVSTR